MSKRRKYGRIAPDDLFRYLSDEMSDEERNVLEREAQRDPFVADALEGLSLKGTREARKDIDRLRARLERRVGMRRSLVWIPVAASVTLMLALGALYFTVFSDRFGRVDRMIAESESVETAKEKRAAEKMAAPVPLEETGKALAVERPEERPVEIPEEKPVESPPEKKTKQRDDAGTRRESPDDRTVPSESREYMAAGAIADQEPSVPVNEKALEVDQLTEFEEEETLDVFDAGMASTEGVRSESKMARAKKAPEEEAPGETLAVRMMPGQPVPEAVALEETIPDTIPAMPAGGMESFRRYIESNLRFPEGDNLPEEGIVGLSFDLDPQGHPRNIVAVKSPGDAFSREAIRLLGEGPAWSPEYIHGDPTGEKIRIQIEFRKR